MQQVIVNLLLNAIDATLVTKNRPKIIMISICSAENSRKYVDFSVKDNGNGFPQFETEQYFEPFYTTKESGMGMGLSICQTIVEAHHGMIKAENVEPYGALVTVRLPAIRASS
ncbi:ATP-binding protein [Acetobacter sp.]|uniref:ATP-binding protein n=1 Tax=Acetobacter sp. TaxID=440 RepID=UPI0025C34A61|nr:ATP-binding protein [Acetobacter sp.]